MKSTKPPYTTPEMLQMEVVECGAAALGIILGYYDRFEPLHELRVACGVSRDGSKASSIVKAANEYGLQHKAQRSSLKDIQSIERPVIIFWNFNHFLVFEGIKGNWAYINDPASGRRKVSIDEFDSSYTGIVLEFWPTEKFEKKGSPFSPLTIILKWFERLSPKYLSLLWIGLVSTLPILVLPIFSKVYVDQIIVNGLLDWLVPLCGAMLLTIAIKTIVEWIQKIYLARLEIKMNTVTSFQFFRKLLSFDYSFYQNRLAAEVASRITQLRQLTYFLTYDIGSLVYNMFALVLFLIILFFFSYKLTLVTIGFSAINVWILSFVTKKKKELSQVIANDEGKLMASTINGFQMIETLKANGRELDFTNKWIGIKARLSSVKQRHAYWQGIMDVLPELLYLLNLVIIFYIGGLMVMAGEMTIGILLAFTVYIQYFYKPLEKLVLVIDTLGEMSGVLNRIEEVIAMPIQEQEKDDSEMNPRLGIEIKNLDFGYNKQQPALFNNLSISIKKGERVAFVGSSGSGKSTLAKICSGLIKPWSGEILIQGVPLHKIDPTVLSSKMSIVDQQSFLFEGSIKEILSLWNPDIATSDIIKACKDAEIHNDIVALEGDYSYVLKEAGKNLSGGQRQRLEIARALISDPEVLVFDEATSALDPVTEKRIDENLRSRTCTMIIIAHRLSTIRDCDKIYVLHHGEVVEQGTHEDLLQLDGYYKRLISADE